MVCPCVALPFLVGGAAGASYSKSQMAVLSVALTMVFVLFLTYRAMANNCSKCKAF